VRDNADRKFAGQFTDGVRSHPVGHEKDVSPVPPLLFVAGKQDAVAVLIVRAPDAHVGQACVLDVVEAGHCVTPTSVVTACMLQRGPDVE
jgi:hypothetical protein